MTEAVTRKPFRYSSQNWFPKVSAAVFAGFLLSVGITGVILRFGMGEVGIFSIYGQFLMWLIAPLWLLQISLCFLFRSGTQAWSVLALANACVWALVYIGQIL